MDGYVPCYNVKRCGILATHAKKNKILEATDVKRNHMQSYLLLDYVYIKTCWQLYQMIYHIESL
jgi:hypothetical protein